MLQMGRLTARLRNGTLSQEQFNVLQAEQLAHRDRLAKYVEQYGTMPPELVVAAEERSRIRAPVRQVGNRQYRTA